MELNSFERRDRFVPERHNLAFFGPGADFQTPRQAGPLHEKRMIARGGEGLRKVCENCFAVMFYGRGFTMHQAFRADDFAAVGNAQRLMTQANAQYRHWAFAWVINS